MNNIVKQIEKTALLKRKRSELKDELKIVKEQIQKIQETCSHMGVYMGNYGNDRNFICLLCDKKLSDIEIMDLCQKGLFIYADKYLNKPCTLVAYDKKLQKIIEEVCEISKEEPDLNKNQICVKVNKKISVK